MFGHPTYTYIDFYDEVLVSLSSKIIFTAEKKIDREWMKFNFSNQTWSTGHYHDSFGLVLLS